MANGLFGSGTDIRPINQTRIQPAGIPGSTFVRPQQREAGGNLRALADALSGLNGSLQNFAAVSQREQKDPDSEANRAFADSIAGMSLSEAMQKFPEAKNRIQKDGVLTLVGSKGAYEFRQHLTEQYNNGGFDQNTGDFNTWAEGERQKFAGGLQDPAMKAAFFRGTDNWMQQFGEKDLQRRVENLTTERNSAVVDEFRMIADDGLTASNDPKSIAEQIFRQSAQNREFRGLDGKAQNDTLFALAEEYALKGEEGIARAILEGVRTGSDGKPIPSLSKISGYADRSIKLLKQAEALRDERAREQGFNDFTKVDELVNRGAFTKEAAEGYRGKGVFTDAQLASHLDQSNRNKASMEAKYAADQEKKALRRQSEAEETKVNADAYGALGRFGGINEIRDIEVSNASGEGTRTITAKTQIDNAIDRKEDELADEQESRISRGEDTATVKAQVNRKRLDWYAGNKIENEDWKNTLNGIAGRGTLDTLLQKGEVPAYMQESAELYRNLKATNPAYLSTLLSDPKSKDFLEAYDENVSTYRVPPQEAMIDAARVVSRPENLKARSMVSQGDAERIAKSTLRDLGVDENSSNYQYVLQRIESMSRRDVSQDHIKQRLSDEINSTAVPINGVLVFDHKDLPDDFPQLMQEELDKRFKERGKRYGLTDASSLYVVADPSESRWYVYSKTLPGLVVGAEPITPATLNARRADRARAYEEKMKAVTSAKDADRAALKKQYDAEAVAEQENIDSWTKKATSRKGRMSGTLADRIAKKLQSNLDNRLAKDRDAWSLSPADRLTNDAVRKFGSEADEYRKRNPEAPFKRKPMRGQSENRAPEKVHIRIGPFEFNG